MTSQEFWNKVEVGEIYSDGWFRVGKTEAYSNSEGQSFGHRYKDNTVFVIDNGETVEII